MAILGGLRIVGDAQSVPGEQMVLPLRGPHEWQHSVHTFSKYPWVMQIPNKTKTGTLLFVLGAGFTASVKRH